MDVDNPERKTRKRHRPLESFGPSLMQTLLRGMQEPLELYAEEDKSPPVLLTTKSAIPSDVDAACVVSTRWHHCVFSTPKAATRFRQFFKLAQRLNSLRRAMKEAGHSEADRVYSVIISVDDRTGAFRITPPDVGLNGLLADLAPGNAASIALSEPEHEDPLATLLGGSNGA